MRRKPNNRADAGQSAMNPRYNPLIRKSDRVQAMFKHWVIALSILMVPLAVWLGSTSWASQTALAEQQQTSRHQVQAVTKSAVPPSSMTATEYTPTAATTVPATWTWQGAARSGNVGVPPGTDDAATVKIWVDDSGMLARAPITLSDAEASSILSGVLVWLLVTGMMAGLYFMIRFRLEQSRLEEWDRELTGFLKENSY